MEKIHYAEIEIKKTGDIFSPVFNDIYFSPAGGYMESLHVFLEPNNIPQRFCNKKKTNIFEAGFGTGLNFLITWKLFNQFAPKNACFEFTSFESFPIKQDHMEKAHSYFHLLRYESDTFLKKYCSTDLKPGLNQFLFKDKRVKLNLIVDDIKNCRNYPMDISYDAWFLDGFNPKENPQMWTDSFFDFMGEKSLKNASFSTFSAAGFIKRGLKEKGFLVEKIKGFNRKREMTRGVKS